MTEQLPGYIKQRQQEIERKRRLDNLIRVGRSGSEEAGNIATGLAGEKFTVNDDGRIVATNGAATQRLVLVY